MVEEGLQFLEGPDRREIIRIEGDPMRDEATIAIVDRGGIAAKIASRVDRDPVLRGTKHRVAIDGRVLVTGGLSLTGEALRAAYFIDGENVTGPLAMQAARFGHTATLITVGPMKGGVLIAGGFTTDASGEITPAQGAEIFLP